MISQELEDLIKPITKMNMDLTHIRMLYQILKLGKFENVCEVGSFDGASAIAFIQALNDEYIQSVTFCDLEFQPRFLNVMGKAIHPNKITISKQSSHITLNSTEFDFVLIDGDHSLKNVEREVNLMLKNNIKHIAAHDSNSTHVGFGECEGARMLKNTYQKLAIFETVEDCISRLGERTDRGFFFASQNWDLVKLLRKEVFNK
jgi:hypothetical protein